MKLNAFRGNKSFCHIFNLITIFSLLLDMNLCLSINSIFSINGGNKNKSKSLILNSEFAKNETRINASKTYFLVDPSKFWSINDMKTQVTTKNPTSESEFIVINAPSIGIESLIFIKNKNRLDEKKVYTSKVSSFTSYALECREIGRNQGWILKKSSIDIAFGFSLDELTPVNYCQVSPYPHKVEKWFNSVNIQIRDFVVSQLWFS